MMAVSFFSSFWMRSLMVTARLSCATDKLLKGFDMIFIEYRLGGSKSSQPVESFIKADDPQPVWPEDLITTEWLV